MSSPGVGRVGQKPLWVCLGRRGIERRGVLRLVIVSGYTECIPAYWMCLRRLGRGHQLLRTEGGGMGWGGVAAESKCSFDERAFVETVYTETVRHKPVR